MSFMHDEMYLLLYYNLGTGQPTLAKVGRGNSGHSSGLAEVCLLHAKKIELQL